MRWRRSSRRWRLRPLLGGGAVAAVVAAPVAAPVGPPAPDGSTPAASGIGSYYQEGMLGLGQTMYATAGLGRGYDISHAGAPYKGMLGLGTMYATAGLGDAEPGDQSAVDDRMDVMESVSTITPTDLALRAGTMPQVRPVDHPFASGDNGYAGGTFARHLFSGMMGG